MSGNEADERLFDKPCKEDEDHLCTPSCLAGGVGARWTALRRDHYRRRRTVYALGGIPAAAAANSE
jgi:hypothetical protein